MAGDVLREAATRLRFYESSRITILTSSNSYANVYLTTAIQPHSKAQVFGVVSAAEFLVSCQASRHPFG
ncbi:MAG: hypothetical protein V7K71_17515 [Nostoc sp.]|uniref:hypothetical protein n=1 Tax=Nostoc sp. TaxID=1180 RepID=UPI002FFC0814